MKEQNVRFDIVDTHFDGGGMKRPRKASTRFDDDVNVVFVALVDDEFTGTTVRES